MWDGGRAQALGKLSQVTPPGLFTQSLADIIIFTFIITTTHGSVATWITHLNSGIRDACSTADNFNGWSISLVVVNK